MNIIEKEQFKIIGIIKKCEENQLFIEMPKLFNLIKERKIEISNRLNNNLIDISIEVKDKRYTQMMGYEVEEFEIVPDGMEAYTIPKQNYLYYKHLGPSNQIYDAFVKMYDYALEQKLDLDESEFKIEIYHDDKDEFDLFIKLI